MPAGLRGDHSTKAGVWGLITVLEGQLRLTLLDNGEEQILDPSRPGVVAPEQPHRAEPIGPVRFTIDFCAGDKGSASFETPAARAPHEEDR